MRTMTERKWVIIGVLVAVVAVPISTWTAYDIYYKSKPTPPALSISEASRAYLQSDVDYVGMKLDYYLNGERVERVILSVYTIKNTGGKAIVPSDFYSQLMVQAVNSLTLIGVNMLRALPEGITVKFKKQPAQAFSMEPVLLNPGDEITIGLLIDARQSSSVNLFEGPLVSWTARIKDVSELEIKTIDQYPHSQVLLYTQSDSFREQWASGWAIVLTTYSAPVFFALISAFTVFSIFILERKKHLPPLSIKSAALLVILFIFALSTSEIIIFYAFGSPFGLTGAHFLNSVLVACHLCLLGFLWFLHHQAKTG